MGLLTRMLGTNHASECKDVPKVRPDNTLQRAIDVIRESRGNLSNIEYGVVLGAILRSAPARVLIFGQGRDSDLWTEGNKGGTTVFLEDVAKWFREIPNAESHLVTYPGLVVPDHVRQVSWNVILVDGPRGFKTEHPGRGESIRAASELVAPDGIVFVHDYDRPAERSFCDQHLGKPTAELDRMAVFVRAHRTSR